MKTLVMDIETGPRPIEEIEPLLPKIEAPSNYKDEGKIAAYLHEKRDAQIEGAAKSAVTGKVLAVGFLGSEDPIFYCDGTEKSILEASWRMLGAVNGVDFDAIVSFYGHRFDLPFMFRRSVILGVPVPAWFPTDGRFTKLRLSFVDIAEIWQCGDRSETISLDRLAKVFGVGAKTGEGKDFHKLFATDKAAALDYLANDLHLTKAIYERMQGAGQ